MAAKITVVLLAATALLAGCGSSDLHAPAAAQASTPADKPDSAHEETKPLELTAQERSRLGIVTTPAQAVTFAPTEVGYGVVLSHESIAQAVADLQTATGAGRVSQTALARAQKLASGPGALGLDAVETLEKQSSADQAALQLARHKLTALLGERLPWQSLGHASELESLASGHARLVRVTFPSGVWTGTTPKTLALFPMDAGPSAPTWSAARVWEAPQDTNIPGRSFFAFIKATDIPEGSRLQASDAHSPGAAGVLIPAAAVVISNGAYWCYLEKKADTFSRVAIELGHPLGAGYFVSEGIKNGDPVVIAAAGLLLARETNASSESDD
jgi:hypothetical protein